MTAGLLHPCRYNNGRFYVLVDGPNPIEPWKLSKNHHVQTLHVKDATTFAASVAARVLPGDTLFMDFPYFLHPTAIGHWPEVLAPAFSTLHQLPDFVPRRVLLMSLKRAHVMAWAREFMAVTLGRDPGADLLPITWQTESDSVWHQILSGLEGFDETAWICLERMVVVQDLEQGGSRTFFSQEDGHLFRRHMYNRFGLGTPDPFPLDHPRSITFHRKTSNRRVVNEAALLAMLRSFGQVVVVEHGEHTPMWEQVESVASTSILVSVHTSALAIAPLLRPGSVVLELLQRNWRYQHLDESFKAQTVAMGDIHHYAWRAVGRNQTVYVRPRDAERFGNWTADMCDTEECVEAHTTVDVVVDVEAVRRLLAGRLAAVEAGATVAEAEVRWPER